ncbi:MAG: TIGR01777 family protein [Aldersonia sp.]|nr:TIGR01777 family protein [Aldersonia sp.]
MRIVIAGSSGLIGTALVASLRADGHDVARLVRRPAAAADEFEWQPEESGIHLRALDGADAVVNLCGVGLGDKRWNGAYKQELRDSRITSTDVLANAVAETGVPVLVNASGVHYYGDTGDRVVDESSPVGTGFLATLCRDWEAATAPAERARVVWLRSAPVLAKHGGILQRLKLLYSLGLGGRLGSGRQYFPWISMDDEVGAIKFVLGNDAVRGPVNLVGPAPVTNAQFNKAMSQALHRPAPWMVPKRVLVGIIGEFAKEAVLGSPRAIPTALEHAGYQFRHNTIGEALAAALG